MNRAAAVALLLTLGGCHFRVGGGSKQLKEPADETRSLVFGYLDMSDSPADLEYVNVKRVLPKTDKPYWNFGAHEGIYYSEHFPPGSYQYHKFGGTTSFVRRALTNVVSYDFYFPMQAGGFRLETPGIHFLGSLKFISASGGFTIERIEAPPEREVLEKLLPFAQGTSWESRMKQRIEELGR